MELSFKLIRNAVIIFFTFVFLLCIIFGSIYTIKEQEQGVVHFLGKPKQVVGAGINFKIPFLERVIKVDTTRRGMAMGYDTSTNENTADASMITEDFNFVNIDFFIEWQVTDPVKFLYSTKDPEDILQKIVQSSARDIVGSNPIDGVLTTEKGRIQNEIKDSIVSVLDFLDLGFQAREVRIQDSEPPTHEIREAFKSVENARQGMETEINNAREYQNSQIPNARADADKVVKDAQAFKEARINEAYGEVAAFNEMYEEYIKNPDITKKRIFFEAMEEIMPGLEVIIESEQGAQKLYPVKPLS